MTQIECFEIALIRVSNGETIRQVVTTLYRNRRQYTANTTAYQRGELGRVRAEYLATKKDEDRKRYPRFFVETPAEIRKWVTDYCKEQCIPIARFVNSAISKEMVRIKNQINN